MDDFNNGNRDDDDDGDCVEVVGVGEGLSKEKGKRKRQKKQTSPVWNVFELLETKDAKGVMVDFVIDGKKRAKCSWCGVVKNYDSTTGNGNLKRHIDKCYGNNTRDIGQMVLGKKNRDKYLGLLERTAGPISRSYGHGTRYIGYSRFNRSFRVCI